MLELKIEKRDKIGKASKRRLGGKMPAVFYGRKEASVPISVSLREFEKVWKEAGESSVIMLTGLDEDKEALIQEVDFHPVSGKLRHADFYIIEKGKKVRVKVPLEFIGEAPAVKELSGTLVKVLYELEIEVLPRNLPKNIEADISKLKDFESRIVVRDLVLPEDAEALVPADEVVALVTEVTEEVEEEPEAPDLSEIEVEQKGKQEGENTEASGEAQSGEEKKSQES